MRKSLFTILKRLDHNDISLILKILEQTKRYIGHLTTHPNMSIDGRQANKNALDHIEAIVYKLEGIKHE